MIKKFKIQIAKNKDGQSVVEYCVMFSVVVVVLIAAILKTDAPIRRGLNMTIGNAIKMVNESIQNVI